MKKTICLFWVIIICFSSAIHAFAQELTDNIEKAINLNNINQEKIDKCINDTWKANKIFIIRFFKQRAGNKRYEGHFV